ncbi:MAG: hypothetical protein RBT11_08130 [Desulfobacterales bacterium]|jgi:hypothetical protein|nr:hypothetical protein [Desulfobacterales bacterium]
MQAIYFPYTHLSANLANTLSACFKKMTVYQPTARHIDEATLRQRDMGWLDVRVPAAEFESEIESGLTSFRSFGERHGHRKGEATHYQFEKLPFVEDSSSFIIRSELTHQLKEDNQPANQLIAQKERLIQACLFLQFAQDFDRHQEDIEHCLQASIGLENALFKNLTGDEDTLFQNSVSPVSASDNYQDAYMPAERLAAWTRLFFCDLSSGDKKPACYSTPILLITHSRPVFEHLSEQAPENTIFVDIAQDQLDLVKGKGVSRLVQLARATDVTGMETDVPPHTTGAQGSMKTAVIPNRTPSEFLSAVTGVQSDASAHHVIKTLQVNTLVGLVS